LPEPDVLAGGNGAAVRCADGNWEVLQFCEAELVGPNRYRLTKLLRGQCGTEQAMASGAEAGADFVLLDGAVTALPVPADSLGLPLRYRIGPARDDHAAATFTEAVITAEGIGLRPFAPVHLGIMRDPGSGDIDISWIRRTRFGGDSWELAEVPLNEDREAYRFEVLDAGSVLRSADLLVPRYLYTAGEQAADFGGPATIFTVRVAQLSAAVGPGFALEEEIHA
jgi:hypothetical protein